MRRLLGATCFAYYFGKAIVIFTMSKIKKSCEAKKTSENETTEAFFWTDDELELLLKATHEYKVHKAMENVDWESCQSKYSDM